MQRRSQNTDNATSDSKDMTGKALKGVRSQTAVVALRAISSLVYFSIMSRLLSPKDFGLFALITAVTTILQSLSEAGLGSAIIQKKNASKEFISTAFTLSLILGTFFSLILLAGAPLFSKLTTGSNTLTEAYRIMSIIIIIQSITNITWSFYMRKLDFFKYGILQVLADFLSYIVGIVLALKGFRFYAIVWSGVCNQFFLAIILAILKKYQFQLIIVKKYIKEIVGYGGWLTASVIVRNLTNQIDKIIIGRFLPIADLGALNRPQGFIERISSHINGIVDTVLFPILSSIQDDKAKVSRGYIKIVSLVVTFSFFLASTIGLGSKLVVDIFFGSQWEHLQTILIIFSFSMIVHGFSRVSDSFFRSLGLVKKYFLARLINWIIAVVFVIIGCKFGIFGAAVAIAVSTVSSCLIKFLMQSKAVGVSLSGLISTVVRSIIMPALCAVVSVCVRLWAPYGFISGVICFIVLVLASIYFFPTSFSPAFREIVIQRYFHR